jgi:ParD-like antitoxin of type II bacterial toxin-antitoxin system
MANGIPVRLSAQLAASARSAARTQERSLTEQVEHWARLGQQVERVVMASTVTRLKARSHDAKLDERLEFASTADGRAKALELIQARAATAVRKRK